MPRTVAPFAFASLVVLGCSPASTKEPVGLAPHDASVDGASDTSSPSDFEVGETAPIEPEPIDPKTCEESQKTGSYVGCDYWPTVVANIVWPIFDFTVIAANAGNDPADVVVTGPGGFETKATIAPGELAKIYLPWVDELRGRDATKCGIEQKLDASITAKKSAYHLVSTRPVTVYQFSPLEYKAAGGPPGKSWANCPGDDTCYSGVEPRKLGCFAYSADASLLLPSTAMTGNYRVTGHPGPRKSAYFAITGTADGTEVTVKLRPGTAILEGSGASGTAGTITLTLDAGDVAQLVAGDSGDISGSIVKASKPVQIITGVPCVSFPADNALNACDHNEETVFPAETMGKDYFVTVPTSAQGPAVGHVVALYGNVDGTKLTYDPAPPKGAPTTLSAGQVIDLGIVDSDFRVTGDQPFSVGTFMLSGVEIENRLGKISSAPPGDPSQSLSVAVEQYRKHYVFLAPDDYDSSFADVVTPLSASIRLDGVLITDKPSPLGKSGFGVLRVKLGPGKGGAHDLLASAPVGLQVMGYGFATSYQYPGGLDLRRISSPPIK